MDGLLVGGYPLLLYCDVLVNCTINCTGAYSRFVESWMDVDWAVGCIYWPSQGVRGVGWDYTGPALAYFSIPRVIYKLPQVTAVNQHDISERNTRHPNRTPTPWTTTRSPTRPQHPRLALRINLGLARPCSRCWRELAGRGRVGRTEVAVLSLGMPCSSRAVTSAKRVTRSFHPSNVLTPVK